MLLLAVTRRCDPPNRPARATITFCIRAVGTNEKAATRASTAFLTPISRQPVACKTTAGAVYTTYAARATVRATARATTATSTVPIRHDRPNDGRRHVAAAAVHRRYRDFGRMAMCAVEPLCQCIRAYAEGGDASPVEAKEREL